MSAQQASTTSSRRPVSPAGITCCTMDMNVARSSTRYSGSIRKPAGTSGGSGSVTCAGASPVALWMSHALTSWHHCCSSTMSSRSSRQQRRPRYDALMWLTCSASARWCGALQWRWRWRWHWRAAMARCNGTLHWRTALSLALALALAHRQRACAGRHAATHSCPAQPRQRSRARADTQAHACGALHCHSMAQEGMHGRGTRRQRGRGLPARGACSRTPCGASACSR
jgi:hypothetical protein